MRLLYVRISFFVIILFALPVAVNSQTFEWRGPDRTGIYNESNLLKQWPESGPKLLWEISGVGTGYSAVTPTPKAIYITGRKDDLDFLTSLSPDGKTNWSVAYGKSWNRTYPESRCIPTFSDGFLYLVSGQGDIVCISEKGEKVWSVNHFEKYEARAPMFGISESPLVADGKVIVSPGGNKASLVAFDAKTGNVVWEAEPLNEVTQYVNPKLVIHGGKKIIVTILSHHIIGVDLTSGKLLWKVNYTSMNEGRTDNRINHTITPIYRDGYLFFASGYDHIAVKMKLSDDGNSVSLVWKNKDIDPHHGGVVLMGNTLFSSTYETNSSGKWTAVDWTTGKTLWINDWYNKGSVIAADGMLYIYEEKGGHAALVRPSGEKLDIVSSFRITKGEGPYWAHPVISNGRLYLRHGDYLAVYDIGDR